MKRTILLAVALSLVAAVALAAARNIASSDARALLASSRSAFLLDVRSKEEYRQAHLKGAVLIPVAEIERRYREVPRDRPVVVYCAVGSRSSQAAGFLSSKGYREVYNMADGIVGWYKNGYPIER